MDQSILQLKDTAIHLLENTKQTGVNTTQNGTTHICEELQERQRPLEAYHNVELIESKAQGYIQVSVIADNYSNGSPIKSATRERR